MPVSRARVLAPPEGLRPAQVGIVLVGRVVAGHVITTHLVMTSVTLDTAAGTKVTVPDITAGSAAGIAVTEPGTSTTRMIICARLSC
jgi:hypothetical protein